MLFVLSSDSSRDIEDDHSGQNGLRLEDGRRAVVRQGPYMY